MKKTILCILSFFSIVSADPISDEVNSFGSDFYQECLSNENVCFSPYSLFSCLSTAYLGAKENTEKEMAKALHIDLTQKNFSEAFSLFNKNLHSNQINSANAIWLGNHVALCDDYQDSIKDLDIQVFSNEPLSAATINAWVAEKTKNNIQNLLAPSDIKKNTKAILLNAIHFESVWIKPFQKELTHPRDFYINDQESTLTPMMEQRGHFPYYENDLYQLLLLPIQSSSSSYACFFLLPKTSFNDFENTFTLSTLVNQIHLTRKSLVNVHLPKFKVEETLQAKEILQNLGIKKSFSPEADFSGLIKQGNLSIDNVVHKAFFSIEEKGITASAATAVTMHAFATLVRQEEPIFFTADHPFMFGIVDLNSDLVLFLGKLTRP